MAGRYLCYPEYRSSGQIWCGEIPSHWDFRRSKFLFQIIKRIAGELGHSVLSITQKGIKIKDTESGEGQLSLDYSKYQLVKVGDFAMNHMDLLTGYIDISKYDGVTSPDYRVFCSRDSSNIDRYFLYLYQLAYIKGVFFPLGQGSAHLGRWRLPSEEFNGFQWPVPSKKEQEQIANFLDHETAKIDTLIDKQQQLIKLLKEKRQAVISHAVTKGLNPATPMTDSGIEWLGEVPDHWVTPALKYVCSLLKDGTHLPPPRVDDGIPLLSVRNIIDGQFVLRDDDSKISYSDFLKLKQSFEVLEGDVLLAVVGGTLGKTAIVKKMDSFHIQRSVAIFRCKANLLSNIFLNLIFQSKQFEELLWSNVGFSAQPGIYLGALSDFRMPIPPIEEQMKIVEKVSNDAIVFDNLLSVAQKKIALLQERRTALISAAVTGKIDVRNWQPALSELGKEG
jgi:type I restriction enzyme S subunit